MRLLLILLLFNGHNLSAQGQFSNYLPITEGNQVSYQTKTFDDTIWLSREDTLAFRPRRQDYRFKFRVTEGTNVLFDYSRRIGGADPDFNCDFPKHPLSLRDTGEIIICFPGNIFNPPYVHTRRYVVNSNTEIRDTLTINRHFLWSDRDTICTNIRLGDSTIRLVEHSISLRPEIIFLNLHENEATSIDALKYFADSIPINYYYLEHGGERRIDFSNGRDLYSIDPNRIYTENGRKATLEENEQLDDFGLEVSKELAQQLIWKINKGQAIVSVHNNTPDEYSILSYLPEGGEAENTGELFINEAADPDDFIYTTDSLVYVAAKRDCINVILQDEETFVDDGSLSVYCGMKNILYVNVETEHDHLEEQIRLIGWAKTVVEQIINTNE